MKASGDSNKGMSFPAPRRARAAWPLLAGFAAFLALGDPLLARSVQNFYRVRVHGEDEFNRVLHQGVMVVLSKANEYVDIVAPASDASQLRATGLAVELVQEDLDGCVERMRGRPELGAYHSHDEMHRVLCELEEAHPELVHVEEIGDSWETLRRRADRPIVAVKVAYPVHQERDPRPEVLFFAGVHAREIATTEVLISFIKYLLDRRGRDPRVDFLLRHRQIWFIPTLNPDGREHALKTDIWWRKNRRESGPTGSVGVDLNRNFGFRWGDEGHGGGSSSDPHSAIYRGERPFSEPESQALRQFVRKHRFVTSLAYHSYGQYLMYPYGFTTTAAEDRAAFFDLASEMTRLNNYRHGNVRATVGYFSSGRHDDWLYGERTEKEKVMAMEIELGRSFFPDESSLPRLFSESLHANLTLARRAGADPETSYDLASSRMLQVRVANRGLSALKNLEIALVGADGSAVEIKRTARLPGTLERTPAERSVTFLFPLPGETADGGASASGEGLKLRISYLDGGPVRRELPLTLPTD